MSKAQMGRSLDEMQAICLRVLKKTFGYDGFRRNQEQAILGALQGQDVFVLMPTGGGKSLCFVVPALAGHGLVVVVSPLIALMQDQVNNMQSKGIACDYLSSTKTQAEREAILASLKGNPVRLKLLYVTPELLDTGRFMDLLKGLNKRKELLLFAVDEAHCISSWGHDFRPAYCKLSSLRDKMPSVPIMALTATAAPSVQQDILKQLKLRSPKVLVSSFNRPNISYSVLYPDLDRHDSTLSGGDEEESGYGMGPDVRKLQAVHKCIVKAMEDMGGDVPCGIIYTLKRSDTEDIARGLRERGISAAAYHASLSKEERARVLADWQASKIPLVAATIAFGMGIDKAGVRLVVHADLPKTVEGFYQESGRAGRDGLPAQSVLLYTVSDMQRLRAVLSKGNNKGKKRKRSDVADAGGELASFQRVVQYCTTGSCRRVMLLEHFGEQATPAVCKGTCDYCANQQVISRNIECLKDLEASNKMCGGFWRRTGAGALRAGEGAALQKYEPGWGDEDEDEDAEGSDDDEELDPEEAEARALATAAKGKSGNNEDAFLDAMEKAEAKKSRTGAGAGGSILSRLEAAGVSTGPAARSKSSGVPDAARSKARAELSNKLKANTALTMSDELAVKLADTCEGRMYSSAQGSMPSYRTALGAAVRSAAAAKFVLEFSGSSAMLENGGEAEIADLLNAQVASVEQHLQGVDGAAPAAVGVDSCVDAIKALQGVSITFSLLKASAVHKRVSQLEKHEGAVAAAAAEVVTAWKEQLKAKCKK